MSYFEWAAMKRLGAIQSKLDVLLGRVNEWGYAMSAELDRIKQSVERLTSVNQGAVQLLGELAREIRNRAGDEAALGALADEIDARTQELASAVTTNTPTPAPGPTPPGPTPPAP